MTIKTELLNESLELIERTALDFFKLKYEGEFSSSRRIVAIFIIGTISRVSKAQTFAPNVLDYLFSNSLKRILDYDDETAEFDVTNVLKQVNDVNPVRSIDANLFKSGEEAYFYWEMEDHGSFNKILKNAVSDAELELFGKCILGKCELTTTHKIKIPTIEQLPPPNSELKHYNWFIKRFSPTPYFKNLWQVEYKSKSSTIWSTNLQPFEKHLPAKSSTEELLLCLEYGIIVAPYSMNLERQMDFYRWIIESIKIELQK